MDQYREAYAKALKLLNVRFLSEGELRKKLHARSFDDTAIDAVVQTLKEEHLLDDLRLARDVYEYYASKEQYGHQYIVMRLKKRQLPLPEDIERPDELAVAENLAARRFGSDDDPKKIARFLQYRGFSPAVIREMLSTHYGW